MGAVLKETYFCSASMGQVEVLVEPIVMVQVWRNGSVLEALMSSCAVDCVRVRSVWRRVAVESKE